MKATTNTQTASALEGARSAATVEDFTAAIQALDAAIEAATARKGALAVDREEAVFENGDLAKIGKEAAAIDEEVSNLNAARLGAVRRLQDVSAEETKANLAEMAKRARGTGEELRAELEIYAAAITKAREANARIFELKNKLSPLNESLQHYQMQADMVPVSRMANEIMKPFAPSVVLRGPAQEIDTLLGRCGAPRAMSSNTTIGSVNPGRTILQPSRAVA